MAETVNGTEAPDAPATATPSTTGTRVLTSFDPRTGEVTGDYAQMTASELTRAVREARSAQQWWGNLGFSGRKRWLLDWKRSIARSAKDLAEAVAQETGKPYGDAYLEVMLAVEHLDWAARNARDVLGRHGVHRGLFAKNQVATVGYEPYGVVGVIGSWNYPVFSALGSIAYAMAAGNSVVFKPSELTPGVGTQLAESWSRLAPNQPVLQAVTGDGSTGAALCRSRVDKIAFTGSTATARKVMAACADTLTPVTIESGGKDAMIVHVDADIEQAVEAALFGAFGNAGQTCAGIERIYVAESVYDRFLQQFVAGAKRLRPGADRTASYGPITNDAQIEVIREHIRDAIAHGATAALGGPESIREPYVEPVILTDVSEDSLAVTAETFGPVAVVNKVKDLSDAVARANASAYGLGASIFTRDLKTAQRTAERLRAGVVTINSVLGFAAVPELPFGGVGDSGFGRVHGADGLREFSRSKAIVRRKYKGPFDLFTLDRKPRHLRIARAVFKARHARG
ncbi:aldehyde dehydrogenase family protein [Skermania sp. ID1734]|uniref:aldehyde dehydrogenase family protein n=1 Tax=Skermania sp. ID1734 TaxID=2597516 RepID=UPI00117FBDCF|nr:aldehyde dehydrogenase family protein [Skermania sp. ID1734]TSE02159.1 aldehyde dehydrogenase family protein [Skermania sp. ID1734]